MLAICMALIDDEDKDFFEEIYNEYERKLWGFSINRLKNTHLAEEAVSDTFLSLAINFKKVHKLKLPEIIAYTVIINRNICYDILKKESKHNDNIQVNEYTKSEFSYVDKSFDKLIVAEMVSELPEKFRDVIMLKYFYGYKSDEIAKLIRISTDGVKYRLHRAKEILQKELVINE